MNRLNYFMLMVALHAVVLFYVRYSEIGVYKSVAVIYGNVTLSNFDHWVEFTDIACMVIVVSVLWAICQARALNARVSLWWTLSWLVPFAWIFLGCFKPMLPKAHEAEDRKATQQAAE